MTLHLYIACQLAAVDPPIKIGISTQLKSRLSGLQSGSSVRLSFYEVWDIAAFSEKGRDVERFFHELCESDRLIGEWFNVRPETARQRIELVFNLLSKQDDDHVELKTFGEYFGARAQ